MRTSVRNVHLVFLEESRSVWLSWLVEVSTGCYAATSKSSPIPSGYRQTSPSTSGSTTGMRGGHESIRRWKDKFGARFAHRIKGARRKPGST
jgi:hypothetical protein